jgi:hypothetical protein
MRYGFLYLQLAVLGLAQQGCLGGQTGDTTGISDNSPINGGNISAGGSSSNGPDFGSGAPPDGFGGDSSVPGAGGVPAAGSGGQAGSGGAGGSAGTAQGGSAGEMSADAGAADQNALAPAGLGCNDENAQLATGGDGGSDAAVPDATTHGSDGPDCH